MTSGETRNGVQETYGGLQALEAVGQASFRSLGALRGCMGGALPGLGTISSVGFVGSVTG